MSNRREFIVTGMAGAGAVALPSFAWSAEPPARLYAVIYDQRFPDSVAFARKARSLGHNARAIAGEVTALWYDDLHHRWKDGPAAIAGMTTAEAFFCLETLGNDAGLRRVLHVEHRPVGRGVEHRTDGPARLLKPAALGASGGGWSERMAQIVAQCPASRRDRAQDVCLSRSMTDSPTRPMLISWVLAPLRLA
jgi:hypothetical protein